MQLRVGRRVFRRRRWLNLVPLASGTEVVDVVDGRVRAVARWYSLTFLTLTVHVLVPRAPREPGISWSFPDALLKRLRPLP